MKKKWKNGEVVKDLGGEHTVQVFENCVSCNLPTYGFNDDPYPDWRGMFGDRTHSVFIASEYDMIGPDIAVCALCDNTREQHERGLKWAKEKWVEKVQSVTILGRRWFHRGPGNTYHSAQIIVNGKIIHKIDFRYGYGNQFEWEACDWLEANGFMPDRKHYQSGSAEPGWQYFRDQRGIAWLTEAIDVRTRKEL